jgi:putative transposase
MKEIYPKTDVQRCVVHKIRNAMNAARKKDREAIAEALKLIYQANTKEEAKSQFKTFKENWQSKDRQIVGGRFRCAFDILSLPFIHPPNDLRDEYH